MSEQLQVFVNLLLNAAVAVLAPVAVAALILLALRIRDFVKSKVTNEQWQTLQMVVDFAVKAAEQAGVIGQIQDLGTAKKAHAIKLIQDALITRGLDTLAGNVGEISNLIEAAVRNNQQDPETPIFAAIEADFSGGYDDDDFQAQDMAPDPNPPLSPIGIVPKKPTRTKS